MDEHLVAWAADAEARMARVDRAVEEAEERLDARARAAAWAEREEILAELGMIAEER